MQPVDAEPERESAPLFGVEAAYLEAWSALEAKGPYAEFIERWSSAPFAEYVESLRAIWRAWEHKEPLNYVGEHYQFTLMTPEFSPKPTGLPPVPIYLAAVRPHEGDGGLGQTLEHLVGTHRVEHGDLGEQGDGDLHGGSCPLRRECRSDPSRRSRSPNQGTLSGFSRLNIFLIRSRWVMSGSFYS